jgi:alpha-L-rhamnosidase
MFTCGSEATLVNSVLVENCEVNGSMPLLTLKLRPDTPQHYQDITIRDIRVNAKQATLFSINKWDQYFDLKGQPEPESFVGDITLTGITGMIGSPGVIRGNKRTKFGKITLENVDVKASKPGLERSDVAMELEFKKVIVNGGSLPPKQS